MSEFILPIIEILIGIILLFAGGELFIQGAISLSLILGIPQIVIGLTAVSYTHLRAHETGGIPKIKDKEIAP